MKFSGLVMAAVLGGAGAISLDSRSVYQSDELMRASFKSLEAYTSKNGYPNSKKCTLKTASVRKEWFGRSLRFCLPVLIFDQVNVVTKRKDELHQCRPMSSKETRQDPSRNCCWSEKSLR
jgi:hypothetical protein